MTQVFANTDGTETVKVHGEPVHYQLRGQLDWWRIDNAIVADGDRPGWHRNAANRWTVRFGPVVLDGGGVELVTDAGTVRLSPDVSAGGGPVWPVVAEQGRPNAVTYRGVWPGVDVRYVVTGGTVRVDLVVAGGGRAEFPFIVEGLGLSEARDGGAAPVAVTGKQAGQVRLTGTSVSAGAGRSTGGATASMRIGAAASQPGRQRLTVALDAPGARRTESMTVSSTVVVGPSQACSYGLESWEVWCDGVSTGTNRWPPAQHWWLRGVAQFSYRPHVETRDVLYAGVWMSQSNLSTPDPELVNIWEATDWSGHGAVAGGDPAHWIGAAVVEDNNACSAPMCAST